MPTSKTSSILVFLYKNFLGKKVRPLLTKKWFSKLAGNYAESSLSRFHIKKFVKKHSINMDESELPIDAFTSFNNFFIRKLKPHARPIDFNENTITSPSDGAILAIDLSKQATFDIKNTSFDLHTFLGNATLAQEFSNGYLIIFRLAPWDYHRFHFPFNCRPLPAKRIKGKYESVDPLVFKHGIQPLHVNERQLITLLTNTDKFLLIPVGALCVGKISTTYLPQKKYLKGDEVGYFSFGGSTVVLVCKPNTISINNQIISNSKNNIETPVKMGEKVATFIR